MLARLLHRQFLILECRVSGYYAQATGTDAGGLWLEVVANQYLPMQERLPRAKLAALRRLGWHPPDRGPSPRTRRGRSPNYFVELTPPVDAQAAGQLIAVTLRDIYGVPSPDHLSYRAFEQFMVWSRALVLPELDGQLAPAAALPSAADALSSEPKPNTDEALLPADANLPEPGPRPTPDEPVPVPAEDNELVWCVVEQASDGQEKLLVLPRATFEHWMKRVVALSCTTWGELRQRVMPEVYEEICGLCGYGTLDEFTRYLDIQGQAPLSGLYEAAAAAYDPEAVPPADEEPFEASRDIPACADGDWPPAVAYLMCEELPQQILDAYARRYMTTLNGEYAEIPADRKDAVLRDLAALGYRLVEEPRLNELLDAVGV